MAEEKKPDKGGGDKGGGKDKPKIGAGSGDKKDVFFELVWIIFLIVLAYTMLKYALAFFGFSFSNSTSTTVNGTTAATKPIFTSDFSTVVYSLLGFLFGTVEVLSVFISFLLVLGIIYARFKKSQNEKIGKAKAQAEEKKAESAKSLPQVNRKWIRVLEHLNSPNAGDWRLCILEADIMLAELLDKQGYIGASIGDKLKTAVRGDFKTLDNAWEAHKIRNAIAHEGADFALSQNEARRVINQYKSVFEEFYFI